MLESASDTHPPLWASFTCGPGQGCDRSSIHPPSKCQTVRCCQGRGWGCGEGEPAEPPSPVWSVPQRAEVSVKGICQVLIQTDHITYSHPQRARGFTPSRVQTIPFSEMNATRCCPASPTSTGGPISPSPQLMARPLADAPASRTPLWL